MAYELLPLSEAEIAVWDTLVAPFATTQLFHRRAWLDYLAKSRGVELRFWEIADHGRTVGYFCGGLERKGPFRILGSPLKGWGTNYMGPAVEARFDQRAFLDALDEVAASERFSMTEIENPALDSRAFLENGYVAVEGPTYLIPLHPYNQTRLWQAFQKRSQVRHARRASLSVQMASDRSIVPEYYSQLIDVFARQRLRPPYPLSYPELLFSHLQPARMLYPLRVSTENGDCIATGLFLHDDRTLVFWGGACRPAAYHLRANDLLHWEAMQIACNSGIALYDTSGDGLFKGKFGGDLHVTCRWHKSYSWAAEWARSSYSLLHHLKARALGICGQVRGARP